MYITEFITYKTWKLKNILSLWWEQGAINTIKLQKNIDTVMQLHKLWNSLEIKNVTKSWLEHHKKEKNEETRNTEEKKGGVCTKWHKKKHTKSLTKMQYYYVL